MDQKTAGAPDAVDPDEVVVASLLHDLDGAELLFGAADPSLGQKFQGDGAAAILFRFPDLAEAADTAQPAQAVTWVQVRGDGQSRVCESGQHGFSVGSGSG